jgi:hypothetical protein
LQQKNYGINLWQVIVSEKLWHQRKPMAMFPDMIAKVTGLGSQACQLHDLGYTLYFRIIQNLGTIHRCTSKIYHIISEIFKKIKLNWLSDITF